MRTSCHASHIPRAFFNPQFPQVAGWTETDKENFDQFLKTATGTKLQLTLHALVTDRALSVCDCTP